MSGLVRTVLLVLEELFYLVFPLSTDERALKHITEQQFLTKLSVQQYKNTTVLASFKDADVRAAIHLVKFHHHRKATTLTSKLLEAYLRAHHPGPTMLVPVPLSAARLRERGFNQAEVIATEATGSLEQYVVDTTILKRAKHTKPQANLSRSERQQNVRSVFSVAKQPDLSETAIILFDDVITTGATLAAAKAELATLKPKSITCVALAH